jgi:hypothetical protein
MFNHNENQTKSIRPLQSHMLEMAKSHLVCKGWRQTQLDLCWMRVASRNYFPLANFSYLPDTIHRSQVLFFLYSYSWMSRITAGWITFCPSTFFSLLCYFIFHIMIAGRVTATIKFTKSQTWKYDLSAYFSLIMLSLQCRLVPSGSAGK